MNCDVTFLWGPLIFFSFQFVSFSGYFNEVLLAGSCFVFRLLTVLRQLPQFLIWFFFIKMLSGLKKIRQFWKWRKTVKLFRLLMYFESMRHSLKLISANLLERLDCQFVSLQFFSRLVFFIVTMLPTSWVKYCCYTFTLYKISELT